MRKITFADINIFLVKHTFHLRFKIAELTKKSKTMKKIIEKALFEDDEIIIIPNTTKLNLNINQKVTAEKSEFLPTSILKTIIKESKDIVIMNKCLCRSSNDCKDYPHDIGCIFLGPTSKKIPRTICHEASVEEALIQVERADEAGLSHLIGRNKIDSVWMNVKPKEGLLTICHCCPCCCLWKVIPNLDNEISDKVEKLEGVKVQINQNNCKNCLKCLDNICIADAITLKEDSIYINQNKCKGCGHCANICKNNAINLSYTNQSIKTVINRINNLVEE